MTTQPVKKQRWIKAATYVCVCVASIYFIKEVVFSDKNLQKWTEKAFTHVLHTNVSFQAFSFSFLKGFKLGGCHIGALPGTSTTLGGFEEFSMQWDWKSLFKGTVKWNSVRLTGLVINQKNTPEENTLESLEKVLQGTKQKTPQKPASEKPSEPLYLPLKVIFKNVYVHVRAYTYQTHTDLLQLKNVSLNAYTEGHKNNIRIDASLNSSDEKGHSEKSFFVWENFLEKKKIQDIHHISSNFHYSYLNFFNVLFDWRHEFAVSYPQKETLFFPAHLVLESKVNFKEESVDVQKMDFKFGQKSSMNLSLLAQGIKKQPHVSIKKAHMDVDLNEWNPIVQMMDAESFVKGTVKAQAHTGFYDIKKTYAEQKTHLEGEFLLEKIDACVYEKCFSGLNNLLKVSFQENKLFLQNKGSLNVLSLDQIILKNTSLEIKSHIDDVNKFLKDQAKGSLSIVLKIPYANDKKYVMHHIFSQTDVQFSKNSPFFLRGQEKIRIQEFKLGKSGFKEINLDFNVLKDKEFIHLQKMQWVVENNMDIRASGSFQWPFSSSVRLNDMSISYGFKDLSFFNSKNDFLGEVPYFLSGTMHGDIHADGRIPLNSKSSLCEKIAYHKNDLSYDDLYGCYQFWMNKELLRAQFSLNFNNADFRNEKTHLHMNDMQLKIQNKTQNNTFEMRFIGDFQEEEKELKQIHVFSNASIFNEKTDFFFHLKVEEFKNKKQDMLYKGIQNKTEAVVLKNGSLMLSPVSLEVKSEAIKGLWSVEVKNIWDVLKDLKTQETGLKKSNVLVQGKAVFESRDKVFLKDKKTYLKGSAGVFSQCVLSENKVSLWSQFKFDGFEYYSENMHIENVSGSFPSEIEISFEKKENAMVLSSEKGSLPLYFMLQKDPTEDSKKRPVYFERIRPYLSSSGVRIEKALLGKEEIKNVVLDASINHGLIDMHAFSWFFWGGDVVGHARLEVDSKKELLANMVIRASDIDASYFSQLNIEPGKSSQMNADFDMSLLFAENNRDIRMNMNVTKVGRNTLDRFLLVLDPEEKDTSIQNTRKKLKFIQIQGVSAWIRYEQLNMDLAYNALFRIPGTDIGWRPLDREMLRRYSLSEMLDVQIQPKVRSSLGPLLGWSSYE
jgi:hypothetical protein